MYGKGYYLLGTDNVNWKNVNLAILAACNTGKYNDSISVRLNWGGADTTIGFYDSVNFKMLGEWCNNFNDGLSFNNTVEGAVNYANSKNYILDNKVKNVRISGNKNLKLIVNKNNTRSLTNEQSQFMKEKIVKEKIEFNSNDDISKVTDIMKKEVENFDVDNYIIEVNYGINEQDTILDYQYKIGDFYIENNYTVFVQNDRLKIIDNTAQETIDDDIKLDLKNYVFDNNMEEFYKNKALDDMKKENDEEKNYYDGYKLYYDKDTKKKYIAIFIRNVIENEDNVESIETLQYELE